MEQYIERLPSLEVNGRELVRMESTGRESIRTDSNSTPFIEANTIEGNLNEIRDQHIIPVWLKDNEPLISHREFIETLVECTADIYTGEHILQPSIRLSHPIKGRIPAAKDKPAYLLTDEERTIFYERMMFVVEIPSIQAEVDGNLLSLTIGGVKSYSDDNLYQRNGGDQHFKVFVGFQNKVCTNMCVWTDGYQSNLIVKRRNDLYLAIDSLLRRYNSGQHLFHLRQLSDRSITEQQFANLIGRCRMYQYLPSTLKQDIPPLLFGEYQLAAVVKDYFRNESFCRQDDGTINLWRLYNLFTGANKSSYIDTFLDRSVNAYSFAEQIRWALEGKQESWYLR